ncbi:unnamed protein product [Owenia fusiformis]|uniref:Uncharacterized protein n=1 Tax=Owenia fusiformis TaxID=6347 RepID=A0A8J1UGL0_OWEFU|nr:unnamed protein product [Owenia fusiformis]
MGYNLFPKGWAIKILMLLAYICFFVDTAAYFYVTVWIIIKNSLPSNFPSTCSGSWTACFIPIIQLRLLIFFVPLCLPVICQKSTKHCALLLFSLLTILWALYIVTVSYFFMTCTNVIFKVNSPLYKFLFIVLITNIIHVLISAYILYRLNHSSSSETNPNRDQFQLPYKSSRCYGCMYVTYIVAYIGTVMVTVLCLIIVLGDYPSAVMENLDKLELYFVKKGALNNPYTDGTVMGADWSNRTYIIHRNDMLHISGLDVVKSSDGFIKWTCRNVTMYNIPKEFNKLCDDCNDEVNFLYELIVADKADFYKKPTVHYNIKIRNTNIESETGPNLEWRYLNMSDTNYDINVLLQNKDPALDINTAVYVVFYRPPTDQIKLIERYPTCSGS